MSTTPSSLVWLITGASSGMGAALAAVVLRAGHKVIATARNPAKAANAVPEVESLGGVWLELDVTASNVGAKIEEAVKIFGRVDVVVNNAGYSLLGAVEDISDDEARAQMETNLIGPLKVIRAVLPSMRAQNSGTIVNMGSVAGFDALASCGLYAGSKFALEGLSESLEKEVAVFNIRVLLVELGGFRTNFLGSIVLPKVRISKAYEGTPVANSLAKFDGLNRTQRGDPQKASTRIFQSVTGTGEFAGIEKYLRLPLGGDCLQRFQAKLSGMQENFNELKHITLSTDFDME